MKWRKAPSIESCSFTCRRLDGLRRVFRRPGRERSVLTTRNLRMTPWPLLSRRSPGVRGGQLGDRNVWGRIIWGIWWTWTRRLTSMLVCWTPLFRLPDAPARRLRSPPSGQGVGRVLDLRLCRRSRSCSFRSNGGAPNIRSRWSGAGFHGPVHVQHAVSQLGAHAPVIRVLAIVRTRQERLSAKLMRSGGTRTLCSGGENNGLEQTSHSWSTV